MNKRFSGPRADYTNTVDGSVIAIMDLDQGSKSVTNDIENGLEDVRAELGDLAGYRTGGPAVIYQDSTGRWNGPGRRYGAINEPVGAILCPRGVGSTASSQSPFTPAVLTKALIMIPLISSFVEVKH
ncbi:hypothetical protein [Spirosoma koreense]